MGANCPYRCRREGWGGGFVGSITEANQGDALKVCAENIPGVKAVVSHLSWIEPMSGVVISAEDMPKGSARSS